MVAPYAGTKMIPAERAGTAIFIPVTNAIEALNSKLRRAVRARGHFPNDEAALKLLFLVLNRSEKEWKMPPREWAAAKAQMAVMFAERFSKAMAA
jgi:transposase-like protein